MMREGEKNRTIDRTGIGAGVCHDVLENNRRPIIPLRGIGEIRTKKERKTKQFLKYGHSPVLITPSATFDSILTFRKGLTPVLLGILPGAERERIAPRTLLLRKWILLVRHQLLWTWFPRFLDPPLDAAALLARRLAVLDQLKCVQLKTLKGPEGHRGSPEHLEHLVAVMHLFAYDAVW